MHTIFSKLNADFINQGYKGWKYGYPLGYPIPSLEKEKSPILKEKSPLKHNKRIEILKKKIESSKGKGILQRLTNVILERYKTTLV